MVPIMNTQGGSIGITSQFTSILHGVMDYHDWYGAPCMFNDQLTLQCLHLMLSLRTNVLRRGFHCAEVNVLCNVFHCG